MALSFLLLLNFLTLTPSAQAHFISDSAVDGLEIYWGSDGDTNYPAAREWANHVWNALGTILIVPDDWWHIEDLTWEDVDTCGFDWDGAYSPSSGADEIYMNRCRLANNTQDEIQIIAAQEMGHALGLDHSFRGQLMADGYFDSLVPADHDRTDYYEKWGSPPNPCWDVGPPIVANSLLSTPTEKLPLLCA